MSTNQPIGEIASGGFVASTTDKISDRPLTETTNSATVSKNSTVANTSAATGDHGGRPPERQRWITWYDMRRISDLQFWIAAVKHLFPDEAIRSEITDFETMKQSVHTAASTKARDALLGSTESLSAAVLEIFVREWGTIQETDGMGIVMPLRARYVEAETGEPLRPKTPKLPASSVRAVATARDTQQAMGILASDVDSIFEGQDMIHDAMREFQRQLDRLKMQSKPMEVDATDAPIAVSLRTMGSGAPSRPHRSAAAPTQWPPEEEPCGPTDMPVPGRLRRTHSLGNLVLAGDPNPKKGEAPKLAMSPFNGTEDDQSLETWLREYEVCMDILGYNKDEELLRYLPHFLRGTARRWYVNFIQEQHDLTHLTWADTIAEMASNFQPEDLTAAFANFSHRKQKPKETILAYANDLEQLIQRAMPTATASTKNHCLVLHLLETVDDYTREELTKKFMIGKPFPTFKAFRTYASVLENVRARATSNQKTPPSAAIARVATQNDTEFRGAQPFADHPSDRGRSQQRNSYEQSLNTFGYQGQPMSFPPRPRMQSQQQQWASAPRNDRSASRGWGPARPRGRSPSPNGNGYSRGRSNSRERNEPRGYSATDLNNLLQQDPVTGYVYDLPTPPRYSTWMQQMQCDKCHEQGHTWKLCPTNQPCQVPGCDRRFGHYDRRCPLLYEEDVRQAQRRAVQPQPLNANAVPYQAPQQPDPAGKGTETAQPIQTQTYERSQDIRQSSSQQQPLQSVPLQWSKADHPRINRVLAHISEESGSNSDTSKNGQCPSLVKNQITPFRIPPDKIPSDATKSKWTFTDDKDEREEIEAQVQLGAASLRRPSAATGVPLKIFDCPEIVIGMDGQRCQAVIDPGAQVTVVSSAFYAKVHPEWDGECNKDAPIALYGFDATRPSNVFGAKHVDLTFSTTTITHQVLIVSDPASNFTLLLGQDINQRYKHTLCEKQRVVTYNEGALKDITIPFAPTGSSKPIGWMLAEMMRTNTGERPPLVNTISLAIPEKPTGDAIHSGGVVTSTTAQEQAIVSSIQANEQENKQADRQDEGNTVLEMLAAAQETVTVPPTDSLLGQPIATPIVSGGVVTPLPLVADTTVGKREETPRVSWCKEHAPLPEDFDPTEGSRYDELVAKVQAVTSNTNQPSMATDKSNHLNKSLTAVPRVPIEQEELLPMETLMPSRAQVIRAQRADGGLQDTIAYLENKVSDANRQRRLLRAATEPVTVSPKGLMSDRPIATPAIPGGIVTMPPLKKLLLFLLLLLVPFVHYTMRANEMQSIGISPFEAAYVQEPASTIDWVPMVGANGAATGTDMIKDIKRQLVATPACMKERARKAKQKSKREYDRAKSSRTHFQRRTIATNYAMQTVDNLLKIQQSMAMDKIPTPQHKTATDSDKYEA